MHITLNFFLFSITCLIFLSNIHVYISIYHKIFNSSNQNYIYIIYKILTLTKKYITLIKIVIYILI